MQRRRKHEEKREVPFEDEKGREKEVKRKGKRVAGKMVKNRWKKSERAILRASE